MLNKSALTIFVTIALAGFTAAYRPHRRNVAPFTTVPLGKRSTLTRNDGIFDAEKAVRSAFMTKSKYKQNLLNFQRNILGVALSGENAVDAVSHVSRSEDRSRTGSEQLTDDQDNVEWTGPLSIGTPSRSFVIDFDTGSSDLWVPSSTCKSTACAQKHKYDHTKSTTSKHEPGHFTIKYGDGSTVAGDIYADTVSVAGIQVTGQHLAAASVVSSQFEGETDEGILGMAFPSISRLKQPFFQNAIQQKKVASGVFAFSLTQNSSELHLGGTNPRLYSGPIEYHPVVKTEVNGTSEIAFWQLDKAGVYVNGKRVPLSPFKTIIDTGTSIMYGPLDEVKKVYAQVEGSQPLTDELEGLYSIPCDNVPTISFKWGGKEWAISYNSFNLGELSNGSPLCVGALGAETLPYGDDVWLLGDAFLMNLYAVFDVEKQEVGFAQSR